MTNYLFNSSSTGMWQLHPNTIQCVVTSPPYGSVKNYSDDREQIGNYREDMALDLLKKVFRECCNVLKDGGFCCVNIGEYKVSEGYYLYPFYAKLILMMIDLGFKYFRNIVWNKGTAANITSYPDRFNYVDGTERILVFQKNEFNKTKFMKRFKGTNLLYNEKFFNVWNINPLNRTDDEHIAIYPDELVKRLIEEYSDKNDVVLDPFLGSGTTMKVAQEMNRDCVGYEINGKYCKEIIKRISPNQVSLSGDKIDFFFFNKNGCLKETNNKDMISKVNQFLRVKL